MLRTLELWGSPAERAAVTGNAWAPTSACCAGSS